MQENAPTFSCMFFINGLVFHHTTFKGLINFYYLSLGIHITIFNKLEMNIRGYSEVLQYSLQTLFGKCSRKRNSASMKPFSE